MYTLRSHGCSGWMACGVLLATGCSTSLFGLTSPSREPRPARPADSADSAGQADSADSANSEDSADSGATTDTEAPAAWTAVQRTPILSPFLGFADPVESPSWRNGFGPRRIDDVDFHGGLDFSGDRGAAILAAADGQVARTWAESGAQSNAIALVHTLDSPIEFHGTSVSSVYTMYSHLDRIDVVDGQSIVAGEPIGTMGDSGTADTVHLHLELRLGTWCTLEYQSANPDSSCVTGYDPAINPLFALPNGRPDGLEVDIVTVDPFVVRVRAATPVIERVATDLGTVDYDLREGLDASSQAALDQLDRGWVVIEPAARSSSITEVSLSFPSPPAWVEVTDIFGSGWRLEP